MDRTTAPEIQPFNTPEIAKPKWINVGELKALTFSNTDLNVSRIEIIFPCGKKQQGKVLVAEYVTEMLAFETENYSADELAEALDNYGVFVHASAAMDHLSISFFFMNEFFSEIKHLFEEILLKPVFNTDKLKLKSEAGKSSFLVNQKKPVTQASKLLTKKYYGSEHPYCQMAEEVDFDKLTCEDLEQYYKNVLEYKPIVTFSGNPDIEVIIPVLENCFGKLNFKLENELEEIPFTPESGTFKTQIPEATQTAIRLKMQAPNIHHKDRMAFKIFVKILGGYFGSRLMKNIREDKGYTYGIHASTTDKALDSAMFIGTDVGTEHTDATLTEIQKEIEILSSELVEVDELQRVKQYMLGEYMRSADGPFALCDLFSSLTLIGASDEKIFDFPKELEAITSEAVLEIGKKWFTENCFTISLAGNIK